MDGVIGRVLLFVATLMLAPMVINIVKFMKHKYLYIQAGAQLDETSKPYIVMVGTSKPDRRAHAFLSDYARKNGFYFEKGSEKVFSFLKRIQNSVENFPQLKLIDVCTLVRNIKSCSDSAYNPASLHNNVNYLHSISLNFRCSILP